jgi:hypothetical protein
MLCIMLSDAYDVSDTGSKNSIDNTNRKNQVMSDRSDTPMCGSYTMILHSKETPFSIILRNWCI